MADKAIVKKLAEYKGIPVSKLDPTVTDEEVAAELERARTYASTTEDKPEGEAAEMGDQAVIDFIGYIDDEPFEGGSGKDYPLTLGSNTFIPGFEEQLVGVKAGDEVEVKLPFPENYHEPKCAGRDAVFKVTVKSLRTTHLPELTDEVVAKISPCKTVEEFREYVREEIQDYREKHFQREKEDEVVMKVVENSEVEVPQELVDERAEALKKNFISEIEKSDATFTDYLDYNNMTEEMFDRYNADNALRMLRGQAVLSEIARQEGLVCTDQELEVELDLLAREYKASVDELRGMLGAAGIEMVKDDVLEQHALDFLMEQCVEEKA